MMNVLGGGDTKRRKTGWFFFAFRLKDFLEVGGFDEDIFLYCEERTLGKRFGNAGKNRTYQRCKVYTLPFGFD